MIKLSDYLNYLNSEVIQARKKADEEAVKVALEYSKHEYLKFFRVPRFSMPMVKMDIPIKISKIDADTKYEFKMNEDSFIDDVNKKIQEANRNKGLHLSPITFDSINKSELLKVRNTLERNDDRFSKRIDTSVNKIDFSKVITKSIATPVLSSASTRENEELNQILNEAMRKQYTPVAVKLNEIYVTPGSSKVSNKDELLLNLHVVMEDEGIRIVKMRDKEGKEFEEIIFE